MFRIRKQVVNGNWYGLKFVENCVNLEWIDDIISRDVVEIKWRGWQIEAGSSWASDGPRRKESRWSW